MKRYSPQLGISGFTLGGRDEGLRGGSIVAGVLLPEEGGGRFGSRQKGGEGSAGEAGVDLRRKKGGLEGKGQGRGQELGWSRR